MPPEQKQHPPLDYALKYAEFGYRVFPVPIFRDRMTEEVVKHPMAKWRGLIFPCEQHAPGPWTRDDNAELKACRDCKGGHNAATLDPDVIQRYWSGSRRAKSGVGVLPPEGVIVIDDDSHVFDLVWDAQPQVRTASGKSHYYFVLTPEQDGLVSCNQIEYEEPDGLIDIRVGDGKRYALAPCGQRWYQKVNGWTPDPARLPPLPDAVYRRLLSAPRRGSGGGGPGGKYMPGLPSLRVGSAYDREPGNCEDLLERHGWTTDDGGHRWTRPGGSQPSAALGERDDIWFFNVHSTSDPLLLGGHFYTASMLRAVLDFNNDWKACYLALFAEELNRDRSATHD